MKNIAIIGAGQLGSRHLQALALLDYKINIKVVDPSADSLELAKQRFELVNDSFKGEVQYCSSLNELESEMEIVIVATNSKIRRTIIEELVSKKSVKYLILEKVLFSNIDDYDFIFDLLNEKGIRAWVNCPRRMYNSYNELRKQIDGPLVFSAEGGNWGLGCNSIHLLDIFAFLTKGAKILGGNSFLNEKLLDSKRAGYIEFNGSINAWTENGDLFHINSYEDDQRPFTVKIETKEGFWIFDDAKGQVIYSGIESNWDNITKYYPSPFQSQLTNKVIESIIQTGSCDLTPIGESTELHKFLFSIFLSHYNNQIKEINNKICPIT